MLSYIAVLADQGMVHGKASLADILFLAAFIVAVVAAIIAWVIAPRNIWATFVAAAIALVALGFFVL
jgi:hypothetical protein